MRRKIIPYQPYLKDYANKLRKNMTLSEVLLWNQLKNKKMLDCDFDRQRPIDRHIIDFYCKELMLAIEIDGESHSFYENIKHDKIKQSKLESLGLKILRIPDEVVKKNMEDVLCQIHETIKEIEKKK